MEQVIGQAGININTNLKKVSVKKDDLIILHVDRYVDFQYLEHLSQSIKKQYPNNEVIVLSEEIANIETKNLEKFINQLQDILEEKKK